MGKGLSPPISNLNRCLTIQHTNEWILPYFIVFVKRISGLIYCVRLCYSMNVYVYNSMYLSSLHAFPFRFLFHCGDLPLFAYVCLRFVSTMHAVFNVGNSLAISSILCVLIDSLVIVVVAAVVVECKKII